MRQYRDTKNGKRSTRTTRTTEAQNHYSNRKPTNIPGVSFPQPSEMVSLLNYRWQNSKERPKS